MNPLVITAILSLVEEAIKDTPGIIADLQQIFAKANPTPADWEQLRAKVLSISYADYVPASALPPASPATEFPATVPSPVESSAPVSQPGATAEPESASLANYSHIVNP